MIYDEYGQVKFNGVDDYEDGPVAAFLDYVFGSKNIAPSNNYLKEDGRYRRCVGSKYLFSRDQTICLVAYLYFIGRGDLVSLDRVDGKDIFGPANRGHILRCQNKKASWFQDQWLKVEILFHAYFTPTEESNQLIAMMWVAGEDYLKLWVKHNPMWQDSITLYFDSWRAEKELADSMIKQIHEITKEGV